MARIDRSDLFWHEVPLEGGYRILVSSPILKDDFFVPVTVIGSGQKIKVKRGCRRPWG